MEITTPSSVNEVSFTRYDAVVAKSSPEPPDLKRTNTKPLSFTNGVLKRQRHHIAASPPPQQLPSSSFGVDDGIVVYKECLKNHAADLGGHALDGCGEFMLDCSNPNLAISLKCSACGCHRNFHRREPEDFPTAVHLLTQPPNSAIEYRSNHLHQPLPLTYARPTTSPSPSPPPISSSFYPSSAPNMLLALSTGLPPQENTQHQAAAIDPVSVSGRKRFRTKFSSLQKEKMYEAAERVGWKMQKKDEELVNELCNRIGVGKEVFKVWMHNNKTTFNFNKRSSLSAHIAGNANNNMVSHNDDGLGKVNTIEHPHRSLLDRNNLNAENAGDIDMIQHQHDNHNGSFSSS